MLWEKVFQQDKDKCRVIGKKFEEGSWGNINFDEQKILINELLDFLSERLKINNEKKPEVYLVKLDPKYCGAYDPVKNIIKVNTEVLKRNGKETAITVAHELRHAFQKYIIKKVEKVESEKEISDPIEHRLNYFIASKSLPVKLWEDNYKKGNYLKEGPGYIEQPIEFDAFKYEKEFVKLFFED